MVDEFPKKRSFAYTSAYCEENTYRLLRRIKFDKIIPGDNYSAFAVFISNNNKTIPIWRQKAGKLRDTAVNADFWEDDAREFGVSSEVDELRYAVIWDYHVFALLVVENETFVLDLDTTIPTFPCPFAKYLSHAFAPNEMMYLDSKYRRCYRVVPMDDFLDNFASDRSHMRNADGTWISPPPPEPEISTECSNMNLMEYQSMENVTTLEEMKKRLDLEEKSLYGYVLSEKNFIDFCQFRNKFSS